MSSRTDALDRVIRQLNELDGSIEELSIEYHESLKKRDLPEDREQSERLLAALKDLHQERYDAEQEYDALI